MNTTDEIKSKLSIDSLVAEYVNLKHAWKSLKGLCPWHQEKTPSFTVNPEKEMCWCFWCNKWGDIFKFIEYTENVNFRESLQILADKTWVKLQRPDDMTKKEDKSSQIEILTLICEFYQSKLKENNEIIDYLNQRKLWEKEILQFKIWYAPKNWNLLYSYILKLWFKKEDILNVWVLSSDFSWNDIYDRFNWRIIFPIFNIHWQVVAFWWRLIEKNNKLAKYLNSPDLPVYDKSSILFALNFAKEEIKKKDNVVITEGYMDAIACHKIWITNVVASSWTAFTEKQANILKRYTSNFYFCFDNDNAWKEAAKKAIDICNNFNLNLKIIKTPYGKDPDECINHDQELFINSVNSPISIIEFIFEWIKSKYNLSKLEDKKKIELEIFEIIIKIKNNIELYEYLKKLSNLLRLNEKYIFNDFEQFRRWKKIIPVKSKVSLKTVLISKEEYLLWLFFAYEEVTHIIRENIIFSILPEGKIKDIYKLIQDNYNVEAIFDNIWTEDKELIESFELYAKNLNDIHSSDKIKDEVVKTIKVVNILNIKQQEISLREKLKISSWNENKQLIDKYQNIIQLKSKINSIK